MIETPDFILVRHGEVDLAWKGMCYGTLDIPLSEQGAQQSLKVAESLCDRWQPSVIFHSGLTRTRFLADAIACLCPKSVALHTDTRLQERNFGQWQGRTWDEAYATDPENFHGLIEHPDTYRPPYGETTAELQRRAVSWLNEASEACGAREHRLGGPVVAVAHSGPIAAIAGHALKLHARDWGPWMIRTLEYLLITNSSSRSIGGYGRVERDAFGTCQ